MTTKAGRATLADIRQGKIFWEVKMTLKSDGSLVFSPATMVRVLARPYLQPRKAFSKDMPWHPQYWCVKYQTWSIEHNKWVAPFADRYSWVLGLDMVYLRESSEVDDCAWFVSRAAAERWVKAWRNYVPTFEERIDAYDAERQAAEIYRSQFIEDADHYATSLLNTQTVPAELMTTPPTPTAREVELQGRQGASSLGELLREKFARDSASNPSR